MQMAALEVFKRVGEVADAAYLAFDVLPVLWQFSLGPLLNLEQFREFMTLIRALSSRIEEEQTRKLGQFALRGSNGTFEQDSATASHGTADESDFESLVTGRTSKPDGASESSWESGWNDVAPSRPKTTSTRQQPSSQVPVSSWSTPAPQRAPARSLVGSMPTMSRTVTPDQSIGSFASLSPSKPVQQVSGLAKAPQQQQQQQQRPTGTSYSSTNYMGSSTLNDSSNPWASPLPAPPANPWASVPRADAVPARVGGFGQTQQKPTGSLDRWESLL